ncbi:hypothetical protein ABVT39_020940, partial [Epinephelus coioides]
EAEPPQSPPPVCFVGERTDIDELEEIRRGQEEMEAEKSYRKPDDQACEAKRE